MAQDAPGPGPVCLRDCRKPIADVLRLRALPSARMLRSRTDGLQRTFETCRDFCGAHAATCRAGAGRWANSPTIKQASAASVRVACRVASEHPGPHGRTQAIDIATGDFGPNRVPRILAPIAVGIAMHENPKLDPLAVNYNTNGTVDRGLTQINSSNDGWLSRALGTPVNAHTITETSSPNRH
jgi:hypothetical protein